MGLSGLGECTEASSPWEPLGSHLCSSQVCQPNGQDRSRLQSLPPPRPCPDSPDYFPNEIKSSEAACVSSHWQGSWEKDGGVQGEHAGVEGPGPALESGRSGWTHSDTRDKDTDSSPVRGSPTVGAECSVGVEGQEPWQGAGGTEWGEAERGRGAGSHRDLSLETDGRGSVTDGRLYTEPGRGRDWLKRPVPQGSPFVRIRTRIPSTPKHSP